jgi:uncharacterized protein YciI
MKHFIIQSTFTVPFERLGDKVAAHRACLQKGYDQGWILCSGPQSSKLGGFIVARAPSLEAIKAFFANDPYELEGLAQYRFTEFEPVKRQPFLDQWFTGA